MIRTFTYMMFTQVEETLTNDMLLLTDDFIRGVDVAKANDNLCNIIALP